MGLRRAHGTNIYETKINIGVMDYSIALNNTIKKLGTTNQYLFLADLISVGHNEMDAFLTIYPESRNLTDQQIRMALDKIVTSTKFKRVLEDRMARVKQGRAAPVKLEDVELIDDNEVAREVLRSARQLPVGSKERADMYLKYNELRRSSKEDGGAYDGTDNIHFHLPMKCYQCPLAIEYYKQREENGEPSIKQKPSLLQDIIRKAVEMAYPTMQEAYEALYGRKYKSDMRLNNNDSDSYEKELRELRIKYHIDNE